MFDPEYQDIDCPRCHNQRVYFDREIGYYCMSCGHELNANEIVMLIEKIALTSRPIHNSGRSERKPTPEIKELPPRKTKEVEHASHDIIERNKPEP